MINTFRVVRGWHQPLIYFVLASFTWALRLGLLIAIAGLSVGFLMLHATPEQLAQGEAAQYSAAHGVGVTDGGPGLPPVGWSTTGGDPEHRPLHRHARTAGAAVAGDDPQPPTPSSPPD